MRILRTPLLVAVTLAVGLIAILNALGPPRAGDAVPDGCDSTIGSVVGQVSAPGTLPPVSLGDELGFRVGAAAPSDPLGQACALTDIDVYFKAPGGRTFELACRIDVLHEGTSVLCPERIAYEVRGRDVTNGALYAQVRVIANVSYDGRSCITPDVQRDPKRSTRCSDSTNVAILDVVVP